MGSRSRRCYVEYACLFFSLSRSKGKKEKKGGGRHRQTTFFPLCFVRLNSLSSPHQPMSGHPTTFAVTKLFRDCLRLADYVASTQVGGPLLEIGAGRNDGKLFPMLAGTAAADVKDATRLAVDALLSLASSCADCDRGDAIVAVDAV